MLKLSAHDYSEDNGTQKHFFSRYFRYSLPFTSLRFNVTNIDHVYIRTYSLNKSLAKRCESAQNTKLPIACTNIYFHIQNRL